MLSSAAIATAAVLGTSSQDPDFDINELVRRLQILTRVDYVSVFNIFCHLSLHYTLDFKS